MMFNHPSLRHPVRAEVYRAIVESNHPLSISEIADQIGIGEQAVRPAHGRLVALGLIEKAQEKGCSNTGRAVTLWQAVPADRVEDARTEATRRRAERMSPLKRPIELQVELVRQLLAIADVEQLILNDEDNSKQAQRARKAARAEQSRRDRARRERDVELKEAEANGDGPAVLFYRATRLIDKHEEGVRSVRKHLAQEFEDRHYYGRRFLNDESLAELRFQLQDTVRVITEADQLAARCLDDADDDVIDVEAVDVEWRELPPGN